jgi:3-oxoacyl-[acyl-carrier protein] reductase
MLHRFMERVEFLVGDDVDAGFLQLFLAEGAIILQRIALGGAADDFLSLGAQGLCFLSLAERVIEDDDVGPFGVLLGVLGFCHEAIGNIGFLLISYVVPDFVAFLGDLPGDVADQSAEGLEEKLFLFHGALGSRILQGGSGGAKIIPNPLRRPLRRWDNRDCVAKTMDSLKGKIALVTGASRGIGAAVAFSLAGAGADIAVNFRLRSEAAAEVCTGIRKLGRRALAIQADVSQSDQVKRMVAQVERELGAVNILVNNAGMARQIKLEDIAEADWEEHINVNLKSAFLVTQAVLPQMRVQRWGRIINISSTAAQTGGLVGPHYAASKAGMLGLTHSYAALLAKEGITANTVCLALVETDMLRSNPRATSSVIPIGRFGNVDEVASVVLMLAENAYMTGQTVNPNGGWYFS